MTVGKINFTSIDTNTKLHQKRQARNISFAGVQKLNLKNCLLNGVSQADTKEIAVKNLLHKVAKGTKNLLNVVKHALINSEITEFALVKDEVLNNGQAVIKNKEGKIVKEFYSNMGGIGPFGIDYNPKTGMRVKETRFSKDCKTVASILDYDPKTGDKVKLTRFCKDGKTIEYIVELDQKTGNELKTIFRKDGKTIDYIVELDQKTENRVKETFFYKDGKTVDYVSDCDPRTGNKIKETFFYKDGKTVAAIIDYFPKTGFYDRCTIFEQDGKTIRAIATLDPIVGNIVSLSCL